MPDPTTPNPKRVERDARLRWIPIADMHVSPLSQREMRPARAAKIASSFDLEQLGTPTVNERDGKYYVIDGQHRIEALRIIGWGDQQVQCWAYTGLTEEEEAEKFLKLNDTLSVDAFSKFMVGVQAGRLVECDIDRIVRAAGLRITRDRVDGAVAAVGALTTTYQGPGPRALIRSLRVIRDGYGDPGLTALVVTGLGLLAARYEDQLDDTRLVERLSAAHGGMNGLLHRAEQMHRTLGKPKRHCVAAAAVEIYNSGLAPRSGKRLPLYWRGDNDSGLMVAVDEAS